MPDYELLNSLISAVDIGQAPIVWYGGGPEDIARSACEHGLTDELERGDTGAIYAIMAAGSPLAADRAYASFYGLVDAPKPRATVYGPGRIPRADIYPDGSAFDYTLGRALMHYALLELEDMDVQGVADAEG